MSIFLKYSVPEDTKKGLANEVFHYQHQNGGLMPQMGSLTCLLTLRSEKEGDLHNVSRFVWNIIVEQFKYYEGSALEALKSSLHAGVEKLKDLIRNDETFSEDGVDFEITLVSINDNNVYLAFIGDHELILARGNENISVTDLLKEHKVSSGSVGLLESDMLYLSNRQIDEKFVLNADSISRLLASPHSENAYVLLSTGVDFEQFVNSELIDEYTEIIETAEDEEVEEVSQADSVLEEVTGEEVQNGENIDETEAEIADKSAELAHEESVDELEEIPAEDEVAPLEVVIEPEDSTAKTSKTSKTALFTNRLKQIKVGELGQKAGATMAAVSTKSKPVFSTIGKLLNKLIDTLFRIGANIRSKVVSLLGQKYGRKPWFKKFMAKFTQSEFTTNSFGKIRVGGYKSDALRNKRVLYVVLGVVAVLLLIWGIKATKEANAKRYVHEQFITYYEKVDGEVTKASSKVKTDKDSAEIDLFNAKETLNKPPIDLKSLTAEDKAQLDKLYDKVNSVEDQLYNRVVLSEKDNNISIFVDGKISFGKSSAPSDIAIKKDAYLSEYLYIADTGAKSVYQVVTSDTSVKKVVDTNSLLQSPLFIDVGTEGAYVYDSVVGALKIPYEADTGALTAVTSLSGAAPADFGVTDPSEFAIFTERDNLYLLSQARASIMKSQRVSDITYGLPYTYFATSQFSSSTDIFGDSSIYILSSGSEGLQVYAYNSSVGQLENQSVTVTGLRSPFQNLTAGYTGETLDKKLYLFDSTGGRIIVFEKPSGDLHSGQLLFKQEYVYRGTKEDVFNNVKDIVVDAQESKMYVLDGTKIWQISL